MLSLVTVVVAAACATAPLSESESEVTAGLTTQELEEIKTAFDDAACYCEAFLLRPLVRTSGYSATDIQSVDAACGPDGDLQAFDPTKTCSLSAASPHENLPDRGPVTETDAAEMRLNACANPGFIGSGSTPDPFAFALPPGFCRADFNYCVGQQLQLKANSLTRAPSTRGAREGILLKARERFERAGIEYTSTMNHLLKKCDVDPSIAGHCDRVRAGYGDVAIARLVDSVSQVSDVLHAEARSRIARSDATTPSTAPPDELVAEIWGETSHRADAAEIIAGTGTFTSGTTRPFLPHLVGGTDAPYASRWESDHRVTEALRLLITYRVAVPHRYCLVGGAVEVQNWDFPTSDPVWASRAAEAHRALDIEILRRQGMSESEIGALPDPIPPEISPTHLMYGMTVAHLERALRMLHDLVHTTDVDYVIRAAANSVPAPTAPCYYGSIEISRVAQRSRLHLGAALGRGGVGVPAPGSTSIPLMHICSPPPPVNWYDFSPNQAINVGAAGAVHIMRVHMMQMASRSSTSGLYSDTATLASGVRLTEGYVGAGWTEWERLGDGTLVWTLYGDEPASGDAVYTVGLSDENVRCLQDGHALGRASPGGCTAPLAFSGTSSGNLFAGTSQETQFRTWGASGVDGSLPEMKMYVLWRTGAPGAYRYELIDIVYASRSGGVHALGGTFGDLFADLQEKVVTNPAAGAVNSLDLPSDLVPPLEHSLIDDSDSFEDSWAFYTAYAEEASTHAESLLSAAQLHEIEMLQFERASAAQLDAAELAQEEVLSAACGAERLSDDCAVERLESIRMVDLGVIVSAGADPGGPGSVTCPEFMETFAAGFSPPSSDPGDYIRDYIGSALTCVHWMTTLAIGESVVRGLPTRVADELRVADGTGTFSDAGGEVRQQYIALYQKFMDLKAAIRGFDSAYQVAMVNVDLAARQADEEDGTTLEDIACYATGLLGAAAAIASGVVAIITTGGAGLVAGIPAIVYGSAMFVRTLDECGGGDFEAGQETRRAFRDALTKIEEMRQTQDTATRLIGEVALADEAFNSIERRAEIAAARRDVEERIIANSAIAGDPSWRALQGVEARRARDALYRAQRLAFVAQRAIEFRLATDMGTMSTAEPFVPAPATWSADIFTIDTRTTDPRTTDPAGMGAGDATYTLSAGTALRDHVTRLRDFVFGYPFARSYTEGRDTQLVNLRSLDATVPAVPPATGSVARPLIRHMQFMCEGHGLLLGGLIPPIAEPGCLPLGATCASGGACCSGQCEGSQCVALTLDDLPPTFVPCTDPTDPLRTAPILYAEYGFAIPSPLAGYFESRLARDNFNYRIRTVTVNLVGTSILDCSTSVRPDECYADASIQYSMRHDGRVMLEDYEGEQASFAMSPGVIERARSLSAERVLTNPLSSADRALIADYERDEWLGRPLCGTFRIRIHHHRAMDWRNLEDVQLLLRYDYWTRSR